MVWQVGLNRVGLSSLSAGIKKTLQTQQLCRNFHVTKIVNNGGAKIGIVGMGHVGNAVCNNLLRKGYTVTAITDIKPDNCKGYPESIAIKGSGREVAEMSDIVVSGTYLLQTYLLLYNAFCIHLIHP